MDGWFSSSSQSKATVVFNDLPRFRDHEVAQPLGVYGVGRVESLWFMRSLTAYNLCQE